MGETLLFVKLKKSNKSSKIYKGNATSLAKLSWAELR
ncbi:hypothetical protein LVISKB_1859 [Levilactobacillus brevis KB290]|uniref:Uncharacterized protein n=1 Tax=Levilactobacillus brevis KB290 TaxID=1001583 RepID=M5AFA2_LEVBR|nr:hypothetical protein LVISKB_1859 [Levilactobacillus brevis KB290]